MRTFLQKIKEKAALAPVPIVFPEGHDPRIIRAAEIIVKQRLACPVLLGNAKEMASIARKGKFKFDPNQFTIIDPKTSDKKRRYSEKLSEIRKDKGVDRKKAKELLNDYNYFGTMMVSEGDAAGMISGATRPTGETIRPALEIIKTKEPFHKVSGFFFMILNKRLLLFADCAVNIDPDTRDLVDIASDTAHTARNFGISPRIAMLSFSTNGSSPHPLAKKVKEAVSMLKHLYPDIPVDGEMQVDSALVPDICKRKFPDAKVCGNANILVFPDLQSANIAYKLVERLAGAEAIGPVLQGLKKPINDLSRGCDVPDIVNLAAITTIEAKETGYSGMCSFK